MITAAVLKATVEIQLAKADADLAKFDSRMERSAQTAQRAAASMEKAFAGVKPEITGIASMGSALDSLGAKLNSLSNKPHNVQVQARIQAAQGELSRLNTELTRLKGQPATVQVKMDTRAAREQIATLRRDVQDLSRTTTVSGGGSGGGGLGAALLGGLTPATLAVGAATAAVGGLTAALGSSIGQAASFGAEMNKIQATTAASGPELAALKQTALDLGKAMDVGSVNANQAADAIFELSKSGASTAQILDGAAKAALQMSAAAGPEFGIANSANLAANAMNTFSRETLSAKTVADTFVGAANASTAGLGDLKLGFAAVGSVANTVGLSFHDTAESLALFANKGLMGSDAGTSLKTMLLNLQPQTDKQKELFNELGITTGDMGNKFFDAQGKILPLSGIADVLSTSFAGMTDAARLNAMEVAFGSDAIRAAAILYGEGATGVNTLSDAMSKQGDAAGAAATMSQGLAGQWEALQGTVSTLAINFGEKLTPQLTDATVKMNEFLGSAQVEEGLDSLSEMLSQIGTDAGSAAAGLAPLGQLLGATGESAKGMGIDFQQSSVFITEWLTGIGQLQAIEGIFKGIGDAAYDLQAKVHETLPGLFTPADVQAGIADPMNEGFVNMEADLDGALAAIREKADRSWETQRTTSLGALHEMQADTRDNLATIAEIHSSNYGEIAGNALVHWHEMHDLWEAGGDDLVTSANITGATMVTVGSATGISYADALSNALRAGAPALNDYWADLENLFDQQAFMAQAGANNAKAYTAALARELHMEMGDKTGIFRDPALDKWINSNMDQLVREDIRGKRMAGGAGNAAIAAEKTWADVGRSAHGAAKLPETGSGSKKTGSTKKSGTGTSTGTGAKKDDAQSAIKAETDQVANISKAITDGIAALSKLSQFTLPTGLDSGLTAFAAATNSVMMKLQAVALNFDSKGLAATTALAEASSKVYGGLSAGVDFFDKLTEATQKGVSFSGETLAAANQLVASTIAITTEFGRLVPPWKDEQIAQVSSFADASGKVFSTLSGAVDTYSKITEATAKGVQFGGETQAQTELLARSVVATTTLFGSLVPPWKEDQTKQVGDFADASGKIYSSLSGAVDLSSKITEATRAGVTWGAQTQALTEQLARSTVQTTTLYGQLVPPWSAEMTTRTGEYADASGKVLGSLSVAVDFAGKIADATKAGVSFGQDLVSAATQLSSASSAIVQQFASVVPAWDDLANTKVSTYADTAGKVLGLIGTAAEALSKLRDSELGLAQIQSLVPTAMGVGAAINSIAASFTTSMPAWDDLATTKIGAYSETAGKIAGTIGATTDTLTKLRDSELGLAAIQSLIPAAQGIGEATNLIALSFQAGMPAWDELASTTVGQFADSAVKIVAAVGATVDTFQKLQSLDSVVVPWAAMDASMQLLLDSTTHFQNQTSDWDAKGVAASAQLAESASKIVSAIGGAFDLLGKLQELKDTSVQAGALDSVITLLTQSVERFQASTATWEAKGLAVAAQTAESVGKVASALGSGVDVLTKLSTYQAPSTGQIDSYFAGLTLFVQAWQTRSKGFEAEGLAAAAETADSAGKIATGIGAAIDPLVKLGTFQAPSQAGIDQFFAAMGALILGFQAREAAWAAQMTPATVQLASDVQSVTGAISSAIEPLTKMAALAEKPLDATQIDATFALIGLTLQAMQGLTAQVNPDQLAAAVVFGGQLGAALGGIKAAIDLLAGLSGAQVDPAAVAGVITGVGAALASVPLDMAQGVANNLTAALAVLNTVGDQLDQGLAAGIDAGTHWVEEAARRAVQAAIDAGKAEAGIASPSTRTRREWGLPLMQGAGIGVTAGVPLLTGAVRKGFDAAFAVPLPAASFSGKGLDGPPLPPATPGASGSYSKGGGGGGQTIITGSTIVNGTVHASTPTATRELLVGVARREAIKNPGKVRS